MTNCVVICLDTFRADIVSAGTRGALDFVETPNLDALAADGVWFDCEDPVCATARRLTLAYDRPCGCPCVDVSAPGGGAHLVAGRVGSDLIGA